MRGPTILFDLYGTPWIWCDVLSYAGGNGGGETMKIEDIQPRHCFARAQALLGEVGLIREELGRAEDTRAAVDISDAKPRECYFEALATWHKADRLAAELGVPAVRFAHPA